MFTELKLVPFENVGGRFAPRISIRSNGTLGFSQGALKRFDLEDGDWYVKLFFDASQQVIGIKTFRDGNTPGVIKLNKREVGNGDSKSLTAFVSAKAFLDFYGLDYKETRSYDADFVQKYEMILFKLGKEKE